MSVFLFFLHFSAQSCAKVANKIRRTFHNSPASTSPAPPSSTGNSNVISPLPASRPTNRHDAADLDDTVTLNHIIAERELQLAATLRREISLLYNIAKNMKRQARRARRTASRVQRRTGSEDHENLRLAETLQSEVRIIATIVSNKKRHVQQARQRANHRKQTAAAHERRARVMCCFGSGTTAA